MKFELGEILKDKVTSFEGVAMACTKYHTGCTHYGLSSKELKEGKPQDWEWFDETRLESTKLIIDIVQKNSTGGPSQNAPQI